MLIGVISDTHGYLDPRALPALSGVELILHAGDIGADSVIAELEQIAPVLAVRGNVDSSPLARRYPAQQRLELDGVRIWMTHIGGAPQELARALPDAPDVRPHVSIFGHSHIALLVVAAGVLFLNPGAAGRPRFGGGLSVALLSTESGNASARIVQLGSGAQRA